VAVGGPPLVRGAIVGEIKKQEPREPE